MFERRKWGHVSTFLGGGGGRGEGGDGVQQNDSVRVWLLELIAKNILGETVDHSGCDLFTYTVQYMYVLT